jgi:hypothetical protein
MAAKTRTVLYYSYINESLSVVTTSDLEAFVDDSTMLTVERNFDQLEATANGDLQLVNDWYVENRLTI